MIIVSSCLLGKNCKYNGGNNKSNKLIEYLKDKEYIEVCPEVLGGLKIPRQPSEIKNDLDRKVINKEGRNVTKYFANGAKKTLKIAKKNHADVAILKSRSPSCGLGKIYDGTFSSKLVDGNGITTELLLKNNIKVISSDEFE